MLVFSSWKDKRWATLVIADSSCFMTAVSLLISLFALVLAVASVIVTWVIAERARSHATAVQLGGIIFSDKLKQLNEFYYPLRNSMESLWYLKNEILFTLGRDRSNLDGDRTSEPRLLELINEVKESKGATTAMERVIELQTSVCAEILSKEGLIGNGELKAKIRDLRRHFEGMALAWDSGSSDEDGRFGRYPRELDGLVASEIDVATEWIKHHRTNSQLELDRIDPGHRLFAKILTQPCDCSE